MNKEITEGGITTPYYFPCPQKRGRYQNPYIEDAKRSLWDFLLWQLGRYDGENFRPQAPSDFVYPNPAQLACLESPQVTWLNHSSFFIQYQGLGILTDPIWSKRCSPVPFVGPKRLYEVPFRIEDLPRVDLIVISHDHYDHLDIQAIMQLVKKNPEVIFFVPRGVGKTLRKYKIFKILELAWWEQQEILFPQHQNLILRTTSVPAQHFSGRGLFNKNKSLWCGWVFQFFERKALTKQCYFVGDTGYNPYDFVNIGKVFGGFDLSLIPIGTYIPFSFMAPVHICPSKAVQIHEEVKSKLSVGMHWKTFCLSDEELGQPPYDLYLAMKEKELDPLAFRVLNPGQRINW
ncbi:MAG: phospholipase [Chlamydiae bacterium]|nr:phospholipase [Chlamydiota bacterium]